MSEKAAKVRKVQVQNTMSGLPCENSPKYNEWSAMLGACRYLGWMARCKSTRQASGLVLFILYVCVLLKQNPHQGEKEEQA